MKDPKAIKKAKEQHLLKSLKTVENPRRTSIAIAITLFVLLLVVAILGWAFSEWSISSTMFTSSLIGFAFIAAWILFRFGLFSSSRLWFKNLRNKKITKGMNAKIPELTKQEFNDLSKQKSWLGPIVLSLLCGILLFVTALTTFL